VGAPASFVVFCGVDALLRDPQATSIDRASGVLKLLSSRRLPIVLCSGRTRTELEHIQQGLGIADPFICEHGAAVFVRNGYFPGELLAGVHSVVGYAAVEFGRRYHDVAQLLSHAASRARVGITTFSELSVAEVASACGLPLLQARLAKFREYEEGFRLVDRDRAARGRVARALQGVQLRSINDGWFDYAGSAVNLAAGVHWLVSRYRRMLGPIVTIGIGDKPHHLAFLRAVDVPILVDRGLDAVRPLLAAVPRATVAYDIVGLDLREVLAGVLAHPQNWIGEAS